MSSVTQTHNLPIGYPNVNIIIHNEPKKEEEKTGINVLYVCLEAIAHYALLSRPVYYQTYAAAFVAGAAFGLYQARKGNIKTGIEEGSDTFNKASTYEKITLAALHALSLDPAFSIIESYQQNIGHLITSYWAFNLGADASRLASTFINNKSAEQERTQ